MASERGGRLGGEMSGAELVAQEVMSWTERGHPCLGCAHKPKYPNCGVPDEDCNALSRWERLKELRRNARAISVQKEKPMPNGIHLPPLTQEPIRNVDATPDEDYPLRILRAYRANCDCRWVISTDGAMDAVCEMMNRTCEERAASLDKAIAKLEGKG